MSVLEALWPEAVKVLVHNFAAFRYVSYPSGQQTVNYKSPTLLSSVDRLLRSLARCLLQHHRSDTVRFY